MAGEYDFSPLNFSSFNPMSGLDFGSAGLSSSLGSFGSKTSDLSSALTGSDPNEIVVTGKRDLSNLISPPIDTSKIVPDNTLGKVPSLTGSDTGDDDPNALGWNIPTLKLGFGALNSIGNLYASLQSLSLAKKQFAFQKDAYNQNLTNSIQSYNTALDDKARSRAVMEGQTDAERDAYIEKNSLKKTS